MAVDQPNLAAIEAAAEIVYQAITPTPQYAWPLLCQHLGTEAWLKHENHTPLGAFKIRGGLVYFNELVKNGKPPGVISATRGNHGQSVGFSARRHGIHATIVVPFNNNVEKNAAMRALGVELIEHGDDFSASAEYAQDLAVERSLHMVPSFHPQLVSGVASYSLELFNAVSDIDIAYVPIGMGSGICGMIAARDALGLGTKIVGVVSSHATAYARSFEQKKLVESPVSTRLADGMAVRKPHPMALEMIWRGADRIIEVSDDEIANAMRIIYECSHNTCEGAGAAALAAAIQEKEANIGQKVAMVLSGANVDRAIFAEVLSAPGVY